MNATLRRRLERAVRVRDFIRAHRTDGAGEATGLTRLEELNRAGSSQKVAP